MTKQKSGNMVSPKLKMGYVYFIFAVVFLANPCINIIDILPDFFGYVFLMAGLRKWADLCPNISDAMENLKKLRIFMLVKMFAMVLVPLVKDPREHDSFVLLITFSFAIIELIYAIPAVGKIFDGMEYFSTRFDGGRAVSNTQSIRTTLYVFFIVKTVFCLLPELCALSSFENAGYITANAFDIAKLKPAFILINLIISTLAGLMLIVSLVTYMARTAKNRSFLERVLAEYESEIASDENLTIRRNIRSVISLIRTGTVFFPMLWLDGVNIIPRFIGGIFFILAVIKLSKLLTLPKKILASEILFTVISALSFAVSFVFDVNHGIGAVNYSHTAREFYNITVIISLAEYLAMAVAVVMLYKMLRMVIDRFLTDKRSEDVRINAINEAHKNELKRSLNLGLAVFFVSLAVNALYTVIRSMILADFYLVAFIVTIIFIVVFASRINQIKERIEYKYL